MAQIDDLEALAKRHGATSASQSPAARRAVSSPATGTMAIQLWFC